MIDEHARLSLMTIVERSMAAERLVKELRKTFALSDEPAAGAAAVLHEPRWYLVHPPRTPWNNGHIEPRVPPPCRSTRCSAHGPASPGGRTREKTDN
ncbi:hypothetical protein QMK17_06835 [Rhodococcus sp. G-MC3]|uniref:hypothetical protein n=1 Tax=Rhodococcus sp. G-MC3 TaxID=3046209 RepID=UPI0024BAFD9E|nr:hypothetical protein [Rhodococcus sp. G-MC3]MDJ0393043.1 hypothetical protein [Rhodococcus sp. G-MC3]